MLNDSKFRWDWCIEDHTWFKDENRHFTNIFYTSFLAWLKIGRVYVYKNVHSDFKIKKNGGKESLTFCWGLNKFISLLSTHYLAQIQRNVSADVTVQDSWVS